MRYVLAALIVAFAAAFCFNDGMRPACVAGSIENLFADCAAK
jgi:hypothetical protein